MYESDRQYHSMIRYTGRLEGVERVWERVERFVLCPSITTIPRMHAVLFLLFCHSGSFVANGTHLPVVQYAHTE